MTIDRPGKTQRFSAQSVLSSALQLNPIMTETPEAGRREALPRHAPLLVLALILAPVVYTISRGLMASRNVAYMDDIDGTLMLLIRLHEGSSWSDLTQWLFEVSNEHRMATSRLLVTVSYWLTGTVNFNVIGVIGNLFICGLSAVLIRTAGSTERRWAMALILAGFLFQLEHFENFFWAGSSIDHFQVPLLAGGAIVLLAQGSRLAGLGAGALAVLATFTLAHGLVVWPVGALMLTVDRRWRQLAAWLVFGAVTGMVYFSTFQFNPAHHIDAFSLAGVMRIVRFWLELLGAPLALGEKTVARVFGVGLLGLLGWQVWSVGWRRERIALPLAVWAIASLGLVAVGRANLSDGVMSSRYYVLGALAWAMVIFMTQQRWCDVARPHRVLVWLIPGLVIFNLTANLKFAGEARRWIADRDQAVADFIRHGRDGKGPATLHPHPDHATRVIRQAEELEAFGMPRQSQECAFPNTRPGVGFSSAVDRVVVDEHLVTIDGWAAIAGRMARPGDVKLVLRSSGGERVLTTSGVSRPDLSALFPGEKWREAGFHFELRRWLLPPESYQVGFLIPTGPGAELVMTAQRLELGDAASMIERDRVAPNRIVYDELVLRNPTATVTAAPKKPMRVSFLDLHDNLVHVDLSGAGTMTVNLAAATPVEPPKRDVGRRAAYLKGHATVTIKDADESTHLAIFSAWRRPAPNNRGERTDGISKGLAHVASISIASRNDRFGSVRTGNVHFSAQSGITGIDAPGVRFSGPVNIGNISAFASAQPVFQLGFARDTRVVGGDLFQPNGRPVNVAGVWRLRFVAGRTASGVLLPARMNGGKLVSDGKDVSARIARGPAMGMTD